MNDSWTRLTASDPATEAAEPPDALFGRIVSEARVTAPAPRRGGLRRWISRGTAIVLAALLVGGAVSWATGVDPLDAVPRDVERRGEVATPQAVVGQLGALGQGPPAEHDADDERQRCDQPG